MPPFQLPLNTVAVEERRPTSKGGMLTAIALSALFCGTALAAHADDPTLSPEPRVDSSASLPNAPGRSDAEESALSTSSTSVDNSADMTSADTPSGRPAVTTVGIHQRTIKVGEVAPRLGPGDKVLLGLSAATSPKAAVGWLGAALWEMAIDGSPKYGQTAKGFAQRLGAAAARDSSETIFTSSVLAPILHEDPRFYQMGPGNSIIKRAGYAITRTVITRRDNGSPTLNIAFLGGNLAGAALTQAYYPPQNTGFTEVMKTFGGSIGGGAIGYLVDEFFIDTFRFMQHGSRQ
jgi:hypothetical protein